MYFSYETCFYSMAIFPLPHLQMVHVLLQGIYMTKDNCSEIIEQLKVDITALECRLADELENQGVCITVIIETQYNLMTKCTD